MELLVEQLDRRVLEIGRWIEAEHGEPAEVRIIRADSAAARSAEYDDTRAPILAAGGDWREPVDTTVWLRFRLRRPDGWPVEDTALVAQRFGTHPMEPGVRIGRELQRMQGMLYLDGVPYHGIDQYHRRIHLPAGPDYQFAANVWTGFADMEWQPNPVFRLVRMDPGATQLHHDLRVLVDALKTLEKDHPARPDLEHLAESALVAIDWSCPGSAAFRQSLACAHQLVEAGLGQLRTADYEPTMIAAGHAHIDCAWLWPISQTREKAGRTWSTALRLMERYPEYRFLASTPLQYEMVKERFPETFAGIRERVREGRWETVGGMWVEPDCNLPDGESLARQMLIGTRYFEHEFGVETKVVWLPDCFGFTWALPTLMAAAGLPYFVTHKLSWSQTNRIPHDTFRWRGPDGNDVLAHFLCTPSLWPGEHTTYNGTLLPSIARGAWRRFQDRQLQKELLVAFGFGDGGGGPTIEMIEAGRRLKDLPGFPRVEMGRARDFFERLEAELSSRSDVPVWDGELYLEYHRGTYTGQARQKLRNALSQRLYHAAELYAASARALLGAPYPRHNLEAGWRLILTNQFHDILPGSAISSVYVDAEADYQQLAVLGQTVLDTALQQLAGGINLDGDALVVFNPAPFPSADYLELPVELGRVQPVDSAGNPLPTQTTAEGGQLLYVDGVPANGYQAFRIAPPDAGTRSADVPPPTPGGSSPQTSERSEAGTPPRAQGLRASTREVESPFWRIELDERGRISRLWDKQNAREVVPTGQVGNRLVVFEDKPLNFDAWDIDAYFYAKSTDVDTLVSASVLETGPERAVLAFHWRIGERSHIVQRLCVYARSPRIDFVSDVDWQERQSLLKVAFHTGIRNRRATYEIQFGTIDRPTHQNTSWEQAAFEVPAQRWADLSDAHHGVALLADCKHGYSVRDDTLWLSLLKGAIDPDPDADRGQHHFTYSLLPHGAGLDDVRRAGYSLGRPLLWRREAAHAGPLPARFSLANASEPGVVVETAKWAEDEEALIVRLYEADGGDTRNARLALGVVPTAVDQVDLLERNPRPLELPDPRQEVALELRAREIKTLRVRLPS
ncbi:MAG TPA: glycoside hydrolase family 38 C-terminal domain-containing protein [Chloroflexota bacterium]|nr:glycoside hydrolase family 38 C-terminal domain-containing protein [Chloroflexota bacterium]